jgi:hypothetical protein
MFNAVRLFISINPIGKHSSLISDVFGTVSQLIPDQFHRNDTLIDAIKTDTVIDTRPSAPRRRYYRSSESAVDF